MNKNKAAKPRLRGQKLPRIGTLSTIKGPGHLSSFKPLLQPGMKKHWRSWADYRTNGTSRAVRVIYSL